MRSAIDEAGEIWRGLRPIEDCLMKRFEPRLQLC
jgi:hypothetical protein